MSVAASCQNRQPAGTRPLQSAIPAGTLSVKQIAMGGKDRRIKSVNIWDFSLASKLFNHFS